MACGPNLAPERCDVPPSNGAPMIIMSVPAQDCGSDRSALGTPRNVASGPYKLPIRVINTPPGVPTLYGRRTGTFRQLPSGAPVMPAGYPAAARAGGCDGGLPAR